MSHFLILGLSLSTLISLSQSSLNYTECPSLKLPSQRDCSNKCKKHCINRDYRYIGVKEIDKNTGQPHLVFECANKRLHDLQFAFNGFNGACYCGQGVVSMGPTCPSENKRIEDKRRPRPCHVACSFFFIVYKLDDKNITCGLGLPKIEIVSHCDADGVCRCLPEI